MFRLPCLALLILAFVGSACSDESALGPSPSTSLVEAGWSFGFCIGPCRGALGFTGSELSYRVTSRTGDQVFADNRGRLTSQGASRLDALLRDLPGELSESYGCPDCADGGASFVTVARDSERRRSEYEHGNPPPELSPLDAFLRSVMEALGTCQANADVQLVGSCTPAPQ